MANISGSVVLVTGGAGLIGSHLVDALLAEKCRVKILDNLEPQTHPQGRPSWIPEEADLIVGSLQNWKDLERALAGVDFIFHQAAFTGSPVEYSKFLDANATGTARMYEVIARSHLPVRKIVVASSQAVYGEGKYRCRVHGVQYPETRPIEQLIHGEWDPKCYACGEALELLPTDEKSLKNGSTAYAISKIAEERIALSLGRKLNIPTVALRYAVTYGPRQSFSNIYAGVVSIFATRLVNDLPPVVYEDGGQMRDWIYVDDVVQANLFALKEEAMNYEAFNVATGKATSVRQIAKLLADYLNKEIQPRIRGEFRPEDIRHLLPDITKLKSVGFEAKVTFAEGLRRYMRWFERLEHPKEYYSEAEETLKKTGIVEFSKKKRTVS